MLPLSHPIRGLKHKTAIFRVKSHFAWSLLRSFFVRITVSDKVVRHSLAWTIPAKIIGGDYPFYVKTWRILTHPLQNADFRSIFARSASAITPSEKSSNNTNRKSTTGFPMSLRWTSYVVHKQGAQKSKPQKAVFHVKSHFAWRKSATKFLCVKNVSDKVIRHSLA